MKTAAVILAAGQGTRMRSSLPKMLHPLLGRPMVSYAIESASQAAASQPVLVVGYGADEVRGVVGEDVRYAIQAKQLGTAHALQVARPMVDPDADLVLVTPGDLPLLTVETLRDLILAQMENLGPVTMCVVTAADPRGFGRVIRKADGSVAAIVEEASASPEQLAVRELNVGAYCFSTAWIWDALDRIEVSPKGEYYLTDAIALAARSGLSVRATCLVNPEEAVGINTRVHLAEAEDALRQRINQRWMLAGVTIHNPATVTIEPGVEIGQDTVIHAGSHLLGTTRLGRNCVIGPIAVLQDAVLGDSCRVFASVVSGETLPDGTFRGPQAQGKGRRRE